MSTDEPCRIEKASTLSRVFQLQAVAFTSIEARRLGSPQPGANLKWDLPVVDVAWRRAGRELDVHLPFEVRDGAAATWAAAVATVPRACATDSPAPRGKCLDSTRDVCHNFQP